MSRDNVLFAVIGLLVGFIAGYVLHESIAARQPPRRVAGAAAAAVPPGAMPGAQNERRAQTEQGAPNAGGPAMAEVQALRARLDQNPNDREALRQLAGLNFQIQEWPRAIELYERYLNLGPGDPEVLTDLAVSHRSVGDLDRALELFRAAYELEPGYWQAAFNEAYVLGFDRGDLDAAAEVIERLRAREPDNPEVARLAEEIARRRQGDGPS